MSMVASAMAPSRGTGPPRAYVILPVRSMEGGDQLIPRGDIPIRYFFGGLVVDVAGPGGRRGSGLAPFGAPPAALGRDGTALLASGPPAPAALASLFLGEVVRRHLGRLRVDFGHGRRLDV